jgi:hypothetical protein
MLREKRTKGFFVSFDYTSVAMTEIRRFFKQTGNVIVPFTVAEILNEQIAQKLA